jgi:hypothetical protein
MPPIRHRLWRHCTSPSETEKLTMENKRFRVTVNLLDAGMNVVVSFVAEVQATNFASSRSAAVLALNREHPEAFGKAAYYQPVRTEEWVEDQWVDLDGKKVEVEEAPAKKKRGKKS